MAAKGKHMTTKQISIALIVLAGMFSTDCARAQPAELAGQWSVEVTFANGEARSLRFAAKESGKGSFLLLTPESKTWGSSGLPEGSWSKDEASSVTFSGQTQFPLGNVGIDRGTLLLKGKLDADGAIKGEAKFFPIGQDPSDPPATPSKQGKFRATRVAAEPPSKASP